jgi:hypothetical protein
VSRAKSMTTIDPGKYGGARPVRSLRLTSHALSDGRWLMIAGAILVVLGLSVLHSAQRHKTLGGTSDF